MEHLTTDHYLKSINRLFQRTANSRCSLPGMKMTISHFPGKVKKVKKNTRESNLLIGISRRESVISPLLLVVVLCGYQIYQFLKLVYDLFKPEFRT